MELKNFLRVIGIPLIVVAVFAIAQHFFINPPSDLKLIHIGIPLIAVAVFAAVYAIEQHFLYTIEQHFFKAIPSDKLKAILEKESEFVADELALWVRAGDNRVITPEVLKNIKKRECVQLQIAKREVQCQAHREQQIEMLGALQAKEGGR